MKIGAVRHSSLSLCAGERQARSRGHAAMRYRSEVCRRPSPGGLVRPCRRRLSSRRAANAKRITGAQHTGELAIGDVHRVTHVSTLVVTDTVSSMDDGLPYIIHNRTCTR